MAQGRLAGLVAVVLFAVVGGPLPAARTPIVSGEDPIAGLPPAAPPGSHDLHRPPEHRPAEATPRQREATGPVFSAAALF